MFYNYNSFKESLIITLIDSGSFKLGTFTLKSGKTSKFFIEICHLNKDEYISSLGYSLGLLAQKYFEDCKNVFFYGPPYKGIPLAVATTMAMHLVSKHSTNLKKTKFHYLFSRKEEKKHGDLGMYVGKTPTHDDAIIIIDDVLTDSSTKTQAIIEIEKNFGKKPEAIITVANRSEPKIVQVRPGNIPVESIIDLEDIKNFLIKHGDFKTLDFLNS